MFGYMLAGFFQVNISHSADGPRKRKRKDTQAQKKETRKYKKIEEEKENFFSSSSLPFHIRYKSFFGLYKYMNTED